MGSPALGLYIHLMQGTGIVMMLLFLHLFFAPWRRFRHAVEREAFPEAASELDQIRRIVAINLVLGLLTVIVRRERSLLVGVLTSDRNSNFPSAESGVEIREIFASLLRPQMSESLSQILACLFR